MREMLGQVLLKHQLISESQLASALAKARKTCMRLGDVLVGEGMLGYRPLYQSIAQQQKLPFIDLLKTPVDVGLLHAGDIRFYLEEQMLPVRNEQGVLTIALANYNERSIALAQAHYGNAVRFALTSPRDIRLTVQQVFAQELTRHSVSHLADTTPDASARTRCQTTTRAIISGFLLLSLLAIAGYPTTGLVITLAICHGLYSITMLFKLLVYSAGLRYQHGAAVNTAIPDADLPVYTVLIPMFRETESMPHLLSAMHQMDYPSAKLDIKLVLEEDDDDTLDAAYALKPRYQFDIIRVPPSQPRTKPKACNYALQFARGEYLTVYDADDRPDPQQLRKAVAAFRAAPADVACLQARLNYYNAHDNMLTRLFSLEYAMLFHVLLHGLSRLGMPIMLGGTSNHIAVAKLKELGEWDAFNVTEDADLGTRLSARGWRTLMLNSDTLEEAPNSLGAWFRQRSRWIKGYMQTWLVHMRHPARLYKALGMSGFIGFQCFVALSTLSYLTAPFAWGLVAVDIADSRLSLPNWLYGLALVNLAANVIVHIATAFHVTRLYVRYRWKMGLAAVFYPFYLLLHSLASYVALWQLLVKPYVWNKTTHGKAKTNVDFQLTRPMPAG